LLSNHAGASVLSRLPEGNSGGWAYLLKRRTDDVAELIHALEITVAGETMIDPAIVAEIRTPATITSLISPQDVRVLMLLVGGASNSAIAEQIGVTTKSVEHSITSIMSALQIDARDTASNARVTAAVAGIRLLGQLR
jgi:DNA-binding NarL/FixJ family response regulator